MHSHLNWEGLEKFEEGREQQDFSFELFPKIVLTQRAFFSWAISVVQLACLLGAFWFDDCVFGVNLGAHPGRDPSCLDFQSQIYLVEDSP